MLSQCHTELAKRVMLVQGTAIYCLSRNDAEGVAAHLRVGSPMTCASGSDLALL